jgi:ATP-dependent protease ClpP protease subunit
MTWLPLLLRVDQMLDYNVPGGKLNRGMAVYDVLVSIKGAEVSSSTRGSSASNVVFICVAQFRA